MGFRYLLTATVKVCLLFLKQVSADVSESSLVFTYFIKTF